MSRRSGALFLVPLVGAMVFALLTLEERSWGQWMSAIDLITGTTVLTGPIVAACAAHLTWTQARLDPLLRTTPRAGWVPFRCALAAWAWGMVALGVSVVTVILLTVVRPHGGPFPWWAIGIALPVLAVCALAGALVTRAVPHRLTVVAVAPAVFLLGAFGSPPYGDLLRHGPSTGSLAGLVIDPVFWALQAAALVALAALLASGLVVLGRYPRSRRRLAGPVVLAIVATGVLGAAGAALEESGRARLRNSGEVPGICRGTAPTICVAGSSLAAYARTAAPFRRAVQQLSAIGVEVPDRYEEMLPGYVASEAAGQILVGPDAASLRAGARSAATPAGCPQWTDPQVAPEKALRARELIVGWIEAREGGRVSGFDPQSDRWLRRASTPEAQDWVRTTFARLASCDFAQIRMPWSAPQGR